MKGILRYFPGLTEKQKEQFAQLDELYRYWNSQINVISRKDIDSLYLHHVLHSLALAKITSFVSKTEILDVGTGGGFPGIPLAIFFPEVHFVLLDSIRKKIKVVSEVSKELNLTNLTTRRNRAENLTGQFDFVTGRAVTNFYDFEEQTRHLIHTNDKNGIPNGVFYYCGEMMYHNKKLKDDVMIFPISEYYKEDYFKEKNIVYLAK